MPVPKKSKDNQRQAAIARIALLEQLVDQIEQAQTSASSSYHYSELAERSLSNAGAAITEAVKHLALDRPEQVERLQNVAWFYAKFAQDIVGAENTEHLLGNDCFVDLIEPANKVQSVLIELTAKIAAVLDEYECDLPEEWEDE